ncbi:hypothetical protein [Streptomyces sp. NPDC004232]
MPARAPLEPGPWDVRILVTADAAPTAEDEAPVFPARRPSG